MGVKGGRRGCTDYESEEGAAICRAQRRVDEDGEAHHAGHFGGLGGDGGAGVAAHELASRLDADGDLDAVDLSAQHRAAVVRVAGRGLACHDIHGQAAARNLANTTNALGVLGVDGVDAQAAAHVGVQVLPEVEPLLIDEDNGFRVCRHDPAGWGGALRGGGRGR